MAENRKLDLSYIVQDVRNQITHSKEILEQAKGLRDLADKIQDADTKSELLKKSHELAQIADGLITNANTTSSSTSSLPFIWKDE